MLSAAEIASMTLTVAGSLDVTVTVARKTPTNDGYGHTTTTWVQQSTPKVNILKPTATQLQTYAEIIGAQRALIIRFMPTTDIREGDQITFNSVSWLVQNIQNAESYTIGIEALITVVL